MANPLFEMLGNQGLVQQFLNFRSSFRGDPRQQVQDLLNSGRVTQEQYNQAVKQAEALRKMLNMR